MLRQVAVGSSFARTGAVLLAIAAPVAAQASPCNGTSISARFAEASKLCGQTAGSAKAATQPAASPLLRATLPEIAAPVSISMPRTYRGAAPVPRRATAARAPTTPDDALLVAVGQRYRIDPQLLASIMSAESAGRITAISPKGALGLMQVMPATARSVGVREPRKMLSDRALALSAGAAYLKHLQKQFGNNLPLVVAAYNAGPGAVRKYRGIPRYRETQTYVGRVMSRYAATRSGTAPR